MTNKIRVHAMFRLYNAIAIENIKSFRNLMILHMGSAHMLKVQTGRISATDIFALRIEAPHKKMVLPFCTLYVLKVFKIEHVIFTVFLEGWCLLNDNKNVNAFNLNYTWCKIKIIWFSVTVIFAKMSTVIQKFKSHRFSLNPMSENVLQPKVPINIICTDKNIKSDN